MDIRLFICGREVELTDDISFSLNRQFEDLSNPSAIINEWSHEISIPFSDYNNALFGGIFSPNRAIVHNDGTHPNIGLYFDPTRKLDFKLLWNGALLMNGYAKLTSITHQNGKGVYNITLNGQLGRLFQELKKLGFYDKDADGYDAQYDLTDEVQGIINKETIYNAWNNERNESDIIGWACCNDGYNNNDFNASSVQVGYDKDKAFTDILTERYSDGVHNVKISPETLIGDGLLPRSFGEYRSYYQRPYIYVQKMFEILKRRFEALDTIDYKLMLHPKWFNNSNTYYHNLVMMLNRVVDIDDKFNYNNQYTYTIQNVSSNYTQISNTNGGLTSSQLPLNFTIKSQEKEVDVDGNKIYNNDMSLYTFNHLGLHLWVSPNIVLSQNNIVRIHQDNGIVVKLILKGQNGEESVKKLLLVCEQTNVPLENGEFDVIIKANFQRTTDGLWYFNLLTNTFKAFSQKSTLGDYTSFYLQYYWLRNDKTTFEAEMAIGQWYDYNFNSYFRQLSIEDERYANTNNIDEIVYGNWFRSNALYTFRDLWNNEKGFFDEILKYCKLYKLTFDLDEEKKTLALMPLDEYFKKYSFTNYDNKLDYNKDFNITPCVMDTKYLSLGYEDNETKIGADYLVNYGVNFGDTKINTDYNFNDETKKLIDGLRTSIVNTSVGVDWNNMYDATSNSDIMHFQNFEPKPYFETSDYQPTDAFGTYYFYRGKRIFDDKIRPVVISDDTPFQIENDLFLYLDTSPLQAHWASLYYKGTDYYTWLDVVDDSGNLCLFNKPSVSYDITKDYTDTKSIYDNFWHNYLDERYNLQNNKIDCYLDLTPIDYLNFKYNKFITLNNRAYMINKIDNYDATTKDTTHCEIVSIYDIKGYTESKYIYPDYIVPEQSNVEVFRNSPFNMLVYSNLPFSATSSSILITNITIDDMGDGVYKLNFFAGNTLGTRYATITLSNGATTASIEVKINR